MIAYLRTDIDHSRHFTTDRQRIVNCHVSRATPTATRAAGGKIAGENKDDILSETGDLRLDL